jgi:hypothetical protein
METARYEIVSRDGEWFVLHEGGTDGGPYPTKESAFEVATMAASLSIADGHAIEIRVEGGTKVAHPDLAAT